MDAISIVIFSLLLSGGGGNDLLDLVPTDGYWKSKEVELTTANIMLELNSLKPDDTSKAMAVRRLMAIRTLGELKSIDALPSLKAQLDSKEMFVADYAQRAIDVIQGNAPNKSSGIPPDRMKADLLMLPEHCGAVGQIRLQPGKALQYPKPREDEDAAGGDAQSQAAQLTNQMIYVAEITGNVRVDAVTIGVSEDVGPMLGFVTLYVRGQWDAEAIKGALQPTFNQTKTAGETEFMLPSFGSAALAAPSNDFFAMIAFPPGTAAPMEDVGAAIKTGKGKLESAADLIKLIESMNAKESIWTQPIWAAAVIGESYRQAPQLVPFDSITLFAKRISDGLQYSAKATGKDAEAMKSGVDQITGMITEAKDDLTSQAESAPAVQPFIDLLKSVELKSDGTTATGSAVMKQAH